MTSLFHRFNEFLGKASLATYAGGGPGVDPELVERGMKELEYGDLDGEWYYKDSYSGFFQSFGREVVWHNGKPFWCQVYGEEWSLSFIGILILPIRRSVS